MEVLFVDEQLYVSYLCVSTNGRRLVGVRWHRRLEKSTFLLITKEGNKTRKKNLSALLSGELIGRIVVVCIGNVDHQSASIKKCTVTAQGQLKEETARSRRAQRSDTTYGFRDVLCRTDLA